jgi:hypothetical protein
MLGAINWFTNLCYAHTDTPCVVHTSNSAPASVGSFTKLDRQTRDVKSMHCAGHPIPRGKLCLRCAPTCATHVRTDSSTPVTVCSFTALHRLERLPVLPVECTAITGSSTCSSTNSSTSTLASGGQVGGCPGLSD